MVRPDPVCVLKYIDYYYIILYMFYYSLDCILAFLFNFI